MQNILWHFYKVSVKNQYFHKILKFFKVVLKPKFFFMDKAYVIDHSASFDMLNEKL